MTKLAACLGLVALGAALVALSFVWPWIAQPRREWSNEQAQELADISMQLHAESFAKPATPGADASHEAVLQSLREQYDAHQADLEQARLSPRRTARWLKFGGLAAILAGAFGYTAVRKDAA